MKQLRFLVLIAFTCAILSACGIQPTSEVQPTPERQVIIIEFPEVEPEAEVTCWGFDAAGSGFKVWEFTPSLEGVWEELPYCESGALNISWSSNTLVRVDDGWVWSGELSKLKPGEQLGTITCDDTTEQPLYAYKAYTCRHSLALTYSGVKVGSKPFVVVPPHP